MPINAIGSVNSTPAPHAITSRPHTEASTASSESGGFTVISRVSVTVGGEIVTRYNYADGTTEQIISRAPLRSQTYTSKGTLSGSHG